MLTFAGGSGNPVEVTLNSPVTYVVTNAPAGNAPLFDFQGVGNLFNGTNPTVTGTISYQITGPDGPFTDPIDNINSGIVIGAVVANDLLFSGSMPDVGPGDTVTLSIGTVTTSTAVEGGVPEAGSFNTFLVDDDGNRLDAVNGIAVPEPGAWWMVLAGLAGLAALGGWRCWRRAE